MSTTPRPGHTPPPVHYPKSAGRVGHRLRPIAIAVIIAVVILIAAAVTAVIVLSGTTSPPKPPPMLPNSPAAMAAPARSAITRPPSPPDELARTPARTQSVTVRLTSADPITIAHGISITPAPGWTLGTRGPDWVMLYNADSSARMHVTVKTAGGTDVVGVLQQDITRLTSEPSTSLANVSNLTGPTTKALQSANFQQQASIDYTADVSTQQGTIPVLGVFSELLNTSNQLSAFIDFRQTGEATTQAAGEGGAMISSML